MAPGTQVTLVALFVCLLFVRAPGLALRKRNVENKLHEALKVIERQKRHVAFEENERDWPERNTNLYNWESEYPDVDARGYEEGFDMPTLQDLYASQYLGQDLDRNPPTATKFDWNDLFGPTEDKPDVAEPAAGPQPVSQEELDNLFESSDNGEDDTEEEEQEEQEEEDKREYDPSQKVDKRTQDEGNTLSKAEVNDLLAGADGALDGALQGSDTAPAPAVSDAELQNIFSDVGEEESAVDEENDDKNGGESKDDTGEEEPQDINKEWLINQYMQEQGSAPPTSTKKKRSYWHTYPRTRDGGNTYPGRLEDRAVGYGFATGDTEEDTPDSLDLADQLAAARADIKILKNFLALEDEENANLAKALNLATKSQTERSDKYVQDEIKYIKDAIQDEVDLQEIRDVLQIANSLKGSPEDIDSDTDDLDLSTPEGSKFAVKRTFPEPEVEEEDEAVADMPGGESLQEEDLDDVSEDQDEQDGGQLSNEDLVNLILAKKLKDILKQNEDNEISDVYDQPSGLDSWYKAQVVPASSKLDKGQEIYLNPLMRELWQKLQQEQVSKRAEEYTQDDEPDQSRDGIELEPGLLDPTELGGLCPAVQSLTNGCSFMKDLGLGLDEEATELCDRHQMCYSCGAALDLTPNDCDRGYLAEAAMLCDKEGGCDEDAAGLFVIMLKYHTFQPLGRVPDVCADTCTEDFITGRSSQSSK